ncbi:MAG: DeoR/GlpR family DNA-binding transcription regulator, partial [Angelakisella sp.]
LQKDGMIQRSHGGAVIIESIGDESSRSVRELEHRKEKRCIAALGRELLHPNDAIFMDSSSTVGTIAPMLAGFSSLSVITSGLKNAMLLSQYTSAKIYLPGGALNNTSNSMTGSDTCAFILQVNADIALLSCGAVNLSGAVTEVSLEQSQIKRAMLKNSKTHILLCDSSKLGGTLLSKTCGLEAFDYLVTNQRLSKEFMALAQACHCQVVCP